MRLSRRNFLKVAGTAAAGGLLSTVVLPKVFAHGDENAEAFEITMGELYFRFNGGEKNAPFTLESGEMHLIRLKNEGAVTHEIHFGRDPDLEGRFYREDLLGTEGEHNNHGFMAVMIEPGESSTMMFVIPDTKKGEWEIGCFMPGHYEGGQHAKLTVT